MMTEPGQPSTAPLSPPARRGGAAAAVLGPLALYGHPAAHVVLEDFLFLMAGVHLASPIAGISALHAGHLFTRLVRPRSRASVQRCSARWRGAAAGAAAARVAVPGPHRGVALPVSEAGRRRSSPRLHPQRAALPRPMGSCCGRPGPPARMAPASRRRLGGGSRQPLAADGAGHARPRPGPAAVWRDVLPRLPRRGTALVTAALPYPWMVWRSHQAPVISFYGSIDMERRPAAATAASTSAPAPAGATAGRSGVVRGPRAADDPAGVRARPARPRGAGARRPLARAPGPGVHAASGSGVPPRRARAPTPHRARACSRGPPRRARAPPPRRARACLPEPPPRARAWLCSATAWCWSGCWGSTSTSSGWPCSGPIRWSLWRRRPVGGGGDAVAWTACRRPAGLRPSWAAVLRPSWTAVLRSAWTAGRGRRGRRSRPSWTAVLRPSWAATCGRRGRRRCGG